MIATLTQSPEKLATGLAIQSNSIGDINAAMRQLIEFLAIAAAPPSGTSKRHLQAATDTQTSATDGRL
jgi:hypothetical protein